MLEKDFEKELPESQAQSGSLENKVYQTDDPIDNPNVPSDIEMVPVDQVRHDVTGPQDFRSPEEYASFRRESEMLKQMQPAIEQGAGPETWDAWDKANQIGPYSQGEYTRGYTDVWDAFYKNDTIAVEWRGDHYEVLNGRHRLYVAQEAGLKSVPARVIR